MSVSRRPSLLLFGLLVSPLALPGAAFALSDEFAAPLSADWSAPRTEEAGSSVSAPVDDEDATDGKVLELVYPGETSAEDFGPAFATEIETAAAQSFGTYQARLRTPKASHATGLVTGFFTYFNDGTDHDGDGIIDNHEIDVEILAAEPSTINMSVWTEYQADGDVETFRKTTRKVDLKKGRVWETPPGGEGSYELVEVAPMAWTARKFRAWRQFATYRFVWSAGSVEYSIDLGDGQGFRTLWTLAGAANETIPSIPAPLFFNLWHNPADWTSQKDARPPRKAAVLHVDRVSVN